MPSQTTLMIMLNICVSAAGLLARRGIHPALPQLAAALLFLASTLQLLRNDGLPALAGLLFLPAAWSVQTAKHLETFIGGTAAIRSRITTLLYTSGYGTFLAGLGFHLYVSHQHVIYLFAVLISLLLWLYLTLLLIRHPVDRQDPSFVLRQTASGQRPEVTGDGPVTSAIIPFLVVMLCLIDMTRVLFWAGLAALILTILAVIRRIRLLAHGTRDTVSPSALSYLFYIAGASLLLLLILQMPFQDVVRAIQVVGPEDLWLILVPALWVIPYAITLQILLDYRVTFIDALYTQVSGDAFNSITPLLGLGGEPYKARHLSRFVPIHDASRAIIQSRLIHALSGVLFTAVVLLITVVIADLSAWPGAATGMVVIAVLMMVIFALLLWVTMSKVPSHLSAIILSKLKMLEDFRHDPIGWKKMWLALAAKLAGRCAIFLELYLIFLVLDLSPDIADIVLVEALIMISVSLFFFVPQGLGVSEAGIVTAFSIAGYASATGIAYGLIRRARMIIYALIGLLIYLLAKLTRFGSKRYCITPDD